MSKGNKKGHDTPLLEKIIMATALINLIKSIIDLIDKTR